MSKAAYDTSLGSAITDVDNLADARSMGIVTSGESGMIADLSNATAATINSLREAFQLQRMLERDARGGVRYKEILQAHFGITVPDFRLMRPEYLGGSSTRININAVQQTAPSVADVNSNPTDPLGTLGGYAVANGKSSFSKSFLEHGYIISLVNVRADITYQQGLNKMWSRRTKYDHYWPALAHLGEQEVTRGELYWTSTQADNDIVFGYQERYAEYRYKPSLVTNSMRSNAATNLDVWHLSERFGSAPTLNQAFIESNTPMSRVLAVTDENQFILDVYNELKCVRPMPTYSVPGLIDHF